MAAAIKASDQSKSTTIKPANDLEDVGFLHATLAQCGLPRNRTDKRCFERTNGATSLFVEAGRWWDGTSWVEQPLPYGTRPRLVLIHACSEAIRTRNPVIDMDDSARAFLRRLRIDEGGKLLADFRRQMTALAACHMTLGYRNGSEVVNLKVDPVDKFTAWATNDGQGQRALWPGELRLSDRFFETLIEHAVPLDQVAIASLQNSALALDVYTWLTHRLCRISQGDGAPISYAKLHAQFGQEYKTVKDFKKEFVRALLRAIAAYPAAKNAVVPIRGGIRLLRAEPPVKRKVHVVLLPAPSASAGTINASEPALGVASLEMSEALRVLLRKNAPGWDTDRLLDRFKEWMADKPTPRKPMVVCGAWAKAFTKGKPPA